MDRRETRNLEFKLEISKSYLKTVSAFANYGDGEIYFGVDDNGNQVGLDNPKKVAHNIENQINDNIKPSPNFLIEINEKSKVVHLFVYQGLNKPYFYNGKAYKRSDSSTIEVDRFELNRLILEGSNEDFEALPSKNKDLQFNYLENKLIEKLNIVELNIDILKTLSLYSDKSGYNIAAELLSDNNSFMGIEYTQFGSDINTVVNHDSFSGLSMIEQFDRIINVFQQLYSYEIINDTQRNRVELIPSLAFREIVANAIVHRVLDIKTSIKVSFFPDFVEVSSPGGLPSGISKEEYLRGQISILRNPIFGNVFFRLGYIEKFGTGIRRIMKSYENSIRKPYFTFSDNSIVVRLPELSMEISGLSKDESILLNVMTNNKLYKRKEIEDESGFNKDKVVRLLNKLIDAGLITRHGLGPESKYLKN
ncbi:MAG: putative DNA binding domain-containing protein [Erysipelothrix sp.]|nr:putative DNA binding domain-containing protein [Erysipelothrix sp.]